MQFQTHGWRRIDIRSADDDATAEATDQKFSISAASAYNPGIVDPARQGNPENPA
jgi:hypothetical protein